MITKTCAHCKQELDVSCFYWNKDERYKAGGHYASRCNACRALHDKLRRYGITMEQLLALPEACQICDSTENLCIDHDHETEAVRGVLCRECNVALGMFRDDPKRLARALNYLPP